MMSTTRTRTAILLGVMTFAVAACGGGKERNAAVSNGETVPASSAVVPATSPTTAPVVDSTPRKHHSKLGGALVGAAAGHMLGGHAVAGAAAGAILQHERNKHQ